MNPWAGLRGLPREMWMLAAAVLLNRSGVMALPFLVLYLTKTLGFAAHDAGFVLTCYGISALVTAPFAGRLSDYVGPQRLMKASLAFTGVVLFVFPLARAFAVIVASTFVWSAVSESFRPASLAIITDMTMPEQRKAAFALNRLAINLGMSIGPAVGGFVFVFSYKWLFWINGLSSLLAFSLLFFTRWKTSSLHVESQAPTERATSNTRTLFLDSRLMYFMTCLIPVLIIFFQHEAAVPLFLDRDLRLPASAYGFLFTVNTVLIILFEIPLNLATANRPHRQMLALGALLVGTGFGAMVFATNFVTVALTVVVWTFGEMIFLPGAATYMSEIAPPNRRGEYMGLFQMAFGIGFAFSAWLGTAAIEWFGSSALWIATFVAGCVSAAMLSRIDQINEGVSS